MGRIAHGQIDIKNLAAKKKGSKGMTPVLVVHFSFV